MAYLYRDQQHFAAEL